MPKAFSEHERAVIQARLLEEGYKFFSAYGLKKTNVEELAEAVGISKGAFYLFYESKEALFMDVTEQVEARYRREVLAVVDSPGLSPRERLFRVFQIAFTQWQTLPILKLITRRDYEMLARRMPADKLHEHLTADHRFIEELVARCRNAGIPIQAEVDQIAGLVYAVLFASLHEDDFGPDRFPGTMDLLVQLIVAFCLGEVTLPSGNPPVLTNEENHESGD